MTRVEVEIRSAGARRVVAVDDELLAPHRALVARGPEPPPARLAYAAAHVVMQRQYHALGHAPGRAPAGEIAAAIDWDATAALRRHLAAQGFAVAEAMDTAQRFAIGWPAAAELIDRCGALQLPHGFAAGAGADHLERIEGRVALVDGVVEQARRIEAAGGEVILLPMPQLCAWGCDADAYVDVYRSIVAQLDGPVYVHWLGEMFLPALRGYFPGDSFARVMALDPAVVRGAKLSLLDAGREVELRAALRAHDQIVLTGDDFHFAGLIAGGADPAADLATPAPAEASTRVGDRVVALGDFSHALLGILDGIAAPAGLALRLLARGEMAAYYGIMRPLEALARVVFEPPTPHYKAGLAFLAWLDGLQANFMLPAREDGARSREHLARVAALAAAAGVFRDAERTAARLRLALS